MWQLKKLSTNEALNDAGPLPNNWGPIFGLSGIQERLGDLSWLGDAYADMGWVELSAEEEKAITEAKVHARVIAEKEIANAALAASDLTVEQKIAWEDYLLRLDTVCLCADFDCDPKFPIRPNA